MANQIISRMEFLHIAGVAAGATILAACAPAHPTQVTYPRVGLYMTEERKITSRLLGRDYQLAVQVPELYSHSNTKYPVIYVLDGDIFFGMAANQTPVLHVTDGIPEMVVVGINYPIQNYDEFWNLRELDFKIPEVLGSPVNSHADKFLAALKQEMIPFIEENYHVIPNQRVLFGYSSSGFFVLYALFQEPDLFRYYLSGSGDLNIASPYMLSHDQKLVTRAKSDRIDLYLSIGELEYDLQPSFTDFKNAFNTRSYPGVHLASEIYSGERHGAGGAAMTYFKGLREVSKIMRG